MVKIAKKLNSWVWWTLVGIALFFLGREKPKEEEKTASWIDLERVLKRELGDEPFLYIVDETYYVPSTGELNQFVAWWTSYLVTQKIKYIANFFDCDNYSILFTAMSFIMSKFHAGIANSKVHSYNVVVVQEDGNLVPKIVEPQTGQIFSVEHAMSKGKDYQTRWIYCT